MGMYKPSELLSFLNSLGISPKKSLSQNFLIDGNIIRKIVQAAELKEGETVLEIGPGPGSLTQALLAAGAKVIAVEKDQKLAEALRRLGSETQLQIYQADIMDFPLDTMLTPHTKVIANLPYHLTTPILQKIIKMESLISSITVMVQEEVARRFTASPKTSEYSSFTLFLNYYSIPIYQFHVSKHCFIPEPKVDSAVVTFQLHPPPPVADEQLFFEVTRTAFEHRRKMLRSSLRDLFSSESVMEALTKIGKNPESRPEELSLEEFLKLFEILTLNDQT